MGDRVLISLAIEWARPYHHNETCFDLKASNSNIQLRAFWEVEGAEYSRSIFWSIVIEVDGTKEARLNSERVW
jgi:hypothetical protein